MLLAATEMPPMPDSIVVWLTWFHGQYPFVGLLLVMMMLDVFTGLIAAFIERTLSSTTSWVGMGRKVIMLMAVGMGTALEPYSGQIPMGRLIAVFYTFTEGLSIVENMARSGVPIPQQLREALAKIGSPGQSPPPGSGPSVTISHATQVDVHQETTPESKTSDSVVIKTTRPN